MVERINANIDVHVHPFVMEGWNTLEDTVSAMRKRGLQIAALESFNRSIFDYIVNEIDRLYSEERLVKDEYGVVLPEGEVILNAREYNTRENMHILSVGCSFDDADKNTPIEEIIERGNEKGALVVLDHPFVDNSVTRTAGHISLEKEEWLTGLCKKYSGDVTLEWNGYSLPLLRFGLMAPLAVLRYLKDDERFETRYHDVNERAKQLSDRLWMEGYNVPLLADTDLHARNRSMLNEIGAARFIADIYGETPKEIVTSMREQVFKRNYINIERYANIPHVLAGFCVPVLLSRSFPKCRYFTKPRA